MAYQIALRFDGHAGQLEPRPVTQTENTPFRGGLIFRMRMLFCHAVFLLPRYVETKSASPFFGMRRFVLSTQDFRREI